MAKCPYCNLCYDVVYLGPRRFFTCWLCGSLWDVQGDVWKQIDHVDMEGHGIEGTIIKIYFKDGTTE